MLLLRIHLTRLVVGYLIKYPDSIFKDKSHPKNHDKVSNPVQRRTPFIRLDLNIMIVAAAALFRNIFNFGLVELLESGDKAFERRLPRTASCRRRDELVQELFRLVMIVFLGR